MDRETENVLRERGVLDVEARLRAEIERLRAENDVLHKTDKWRYENVLRMKAEIRRLRAVIIRAKDMLLDGQSTQRVHDILVGGLLERNDD